MRQGLRAVFAAFAAVAVIHFFHFVGAATAQTPVKQIELTEKQIQNFISRKNCKDLPRTSLTRSCRQNPRLSPRIAVSRISPSTTMSPPTF